MTRKRFKKLLMGKYGYSRNQAENMSYWKPRTIEDYNGSVIICGTICIVNLDNVNFTLNKDFKELSESTKKLCECFGIYEENENEQM